MHFQINKQKRIYLFIGLFIAYFVCSASAKEADIFLIVENNRKEDLQKILDNFSDKKFDVYLNAATHHGASDHHTAICSLFVKYQDSFLKLNECSAKTIEKRKKYSDIWANELISK